MRIHRWILILAIIVMNSAQIKIANRAEAEIMRYADNTPLWLKHICNFECRPMQYVWAEEIEKNPYVLLLAPPRMARRNWLNYYA